MSVQEYYGYTRKPERDMREAERIAEKVETELDQLIHFLQRALDNMEKQQKQPKQKGIEDTGTVKSKLTRMLWQAEDLGSRASQTVSGKVKRLWDQAKAVVGENIVEPVEEQWDRLFSSRQWRRFFMKHPNLDPREWEEYLRDTIADPSVWKQTLEDAISSSAPQYKYAPQRDLYDTHLKGVPAFQPQQQQQQISGPIVFAENTALITALSGIYMFILLRRGMIARQKHGIYIGDGSFDVALVQDEEQRNRRIEASREIQKILDTIRHASAAIPIVLMGLLLLETNGYDGFMYYGIVGGIACGLLATNEWGIMSEEKTGVMARPLGDMMLRFSIGALCVFCGWVKLAEYFQE
ncbi:hypothetical protein MP638_000902 [Amoeboaphelidium occidentale]|nr:hypothetical protein MP638_000902 [Amoeboaphelidium occidentale]